MNQQRGKRATVLLSISDHTCAHCYLKAAWNVYNDVARNERGFVEAMENASSIAQFIAEIITTNAPGDVNDEKLVTGFVMLLMEHMKAIRSDDSEHGGKTH